MFTNRKLNSSDSVLLTVRENHRGKLGRNSLGALKAARIINCVSSNARIEREDRANILYLQIFYTDQQACWEWNETLIKYIVFYMAIYI